MNYSIDKNSVNWLDYCDRGRFIPLLYISSTGGLCNRILGISSCINKAEVESRKCKVYWPMNGMDGCSVQWSDIFTTPIQLFSEWDTYWLMDVAHSVKWYNKIEDAYVGRDSENIVLVKSSYDYYTTMGGHTVGPAFTLESNLDWCQSLEIRPDILSRAKQLNLPKGTLGIHLRVHEDHFSQDTLFSKNPLTAQMSDAISMWPGRVFISSNDEKYKAEIQKRFGPKILTQNLSSYQRDEEGLVSAITDILALASCETIHGSWSSTFYRLAHYWSSRENFRIAV